MSEVKYSIKFIQEVLDNMDSNIEKFFYKNKLLNNKYFKSDYETAVKDVINTYFEGKTHPDDINKIYYRIRDNKAKKKRRWAESIFEGSKLQFDDKKYPFKELIKFKISATEEDWTRLYGRKNFDIVAEEKLKDVENWRNSKKSKMIEFPNFEAFSNLSAFSAFELDTFFEAYKVIRKMLENGKDEYFKTYVVEMGEAPYFTNSRKKYSVGNDNENLINIPMSEDGSSKLVVEVSKEILSYKDSFKMMDAKDLDIISYLLDANPDSMVQNIPIVIETSTLAKIIAGNDRPSTVHYEEAENRCFRMANATYNRYVDGKQVAAVNFLDSALKTEVDGRRYMAIVVGSQLANETLNNKISRLPAPAYEKLQNNTAKILYLMLQKRRILALQKYEIDECNNNKDEDFLKTTFTYNDFLMTINFGSARKTKNFGMVCEALQEYVDNQEIIRKYDANRSSYTIDVYFYNLSEEEKKNMKNFNLISDNRNKKQIYVK